LQILQKNLIIFLSKCFTTGELRPPAPYWAFALDPTRGLPISIHR